MAFRTQAKVDGLRLPAGKAEHWEFDSQCTGLSVRLQGKKRAWVVWFAVNGKRRKISIGDVAGMRLAEARAEATRIVQGARKGEDDAAERARAKAKSADTLKSLIDVYLERRARPHQKARSYVETERNLMKAWQPLHGHPVDGITRREVAAQLERIRSESGPTAAKNARLYLSGAFSWAMRQGLADSNPTLGTEPRRNPPRAHGL
jgi:Arm DNA-binding domain